MSLKVPHILINVDNLCTLLINLCQEGFDQPCEFRELFLDHLIVLFVLTSDMREEFFKMLRIIHYELVYDSLM